MPYCDYIYSPIHVNKVINNIIVNHHTVHSHINDPAELVSAVVLLVACNSVDSTRSPKKVLQSHDRYQKYNNLAIRSLQVGSRLYKLRPASGLH